MHVKNGKRQVYKSNSILKLFFKLFFSHLVLETPNGFNSFSPIFPLNQTLAFKKRDSNLTKLKCNVRLHTINLYGRAFSRTFRIAEVLAHWTCLFFFRVIECTHFNYRLVGHLVTCFFTLMFPIWVLSTSFKFFLFSSMMNQPKPRKEKK